MQHYDEDTLYKLALEMLDEVESKKILFHLDECEYCSNILANIEKQIILLKSFDPEIENIELPKINQKRNYSTWIKRAAIIIFAMFIGYSGNNYFNEEDFIITGQSFISTNSTLDSLDFIHCPTIDLYSR